MIDVGDKKDKRTCSLDSKLQAKKDEREKKKIQNLKKLLDSISDKNEKINSDNDILNRNLFQLTNLLRVKDCELEIYKRNKNFMNFFQKFKFNKFGRDKLRSIFIARIGKSFNEYKLKELFFYRWIKTIRINSNLERKNERIKKRENKIQNFSISKFQNFYLTGVLNKNLFTSATPIQIFRSENFHLEKNSVIKQFSIFRSGNFHLEKNSVIKQFTILKNENFHLTSKDSKNYLSPKSFLIYKILNKKFDSQALNFKNFFFRNILKFSNFKSIQKNLILFKNILINKKLKYIIQNKSKLEKEFYFSKFQYHTQIKKKFIPKQENKITKEKQNIFSIISKQNHSSVLKFLIQKNSYKHYERISNKSRNLFTLWKLQVKKSKLLEQDFLIKDYKLITQDFTSKFITLERTLTNNFTRLQKFESEIERKDIEISELKSELTEKIEKINLLAEKFQISNSKDNEISSIKEKINSLNYNYETELENLKEENSDLKIKLEESLNFLKIQCDTEKKERRKFLEREQCIEEIEKKVSNLASTNEKLKRELFGEAQKYENLKKISTETAEDIIQSNNELNRIKAENKIFNEKITQHRELADKLNSDINSKERTIRQLKLNEDSLTHQFKLEKDRMEQRVLNERKNLNEKIEFYEKEIDYVKDQLKHVTKDNKNLSDKLRSFTDYNSIKSEVLHLRDKVVNYENENDTVRLQNINLQKQIERGIENLAMENKKYENSKFELEELRNLSRESKEDLKKALEEMEGYADLLAAFEKKIKEAEDAKSNAEKERDNAMNDVKVIRQRYINIIGDKSFA